MQGYADQPAADQRYKQRGKEAVREIGGEGRDQDEDAEHPAMMRVADGIRQRADLRERHLEAHRSGHPYREIHPAARTSQFGAKAFEPIEFATGAQGHGGENLEAVRHQLVWQSRAQLVDNARAINGQMAGKFHA